MFNPFLLFSLIYCIFSHFLSLSNSFLPSSHLSPHSSSSFLSFSLFYHIFSHFLTLSNSFLPSCIGFAPSPFFLPPPDTHTPLSGYLIRRVIPDREKISWLGYFLLPGHSGSWWSSTSLNRIVIQ